MTMSNDEINELQEFFRNMAGALEDIFSEHLDDDVAFTLIVWENGKSVKRTNYISNNTDRETMIKALRATTMRLENAMDKRVDSEGNEQSPPSQN